ncbi:MAG TPA: ribbon-helix-helix protein, CopG family [Xanthobacteraceae bacterium]
MRTTLTIDDDVAVKLERLRRGGKASLKQLINEALRRGLREMSAKRRGREPFRTEAIEGVRPLLDNVDNIAEVLAYGEGEHFK